jgi:hypothetical protein
MNYFALLQTAVQKSTTFAPNNTIYHFYCSFTGIKLNDTRLKVIGNSVLGEVP